MSFFDRHVFFCTNQRDPGEGCCNDLGAQRMRDYAKDKVKTLGLTSVRINSAGCLGRCDSGPVIVIYPEAIWYSYVDEADLDEIIDSHLNNGQVVERLKL